MPQGLTCDEVHDAAPGFALDILDCDSRAEVSAHLRLCPSCRRQVSGMQEAAARLLDLDSWAAPPGAGWDHEPPAPIRTRRRRLRVAVTAVAAATLMVGTALGPELAQSAAPGQAPLARAALMSSGRVVGAVSLYGGATPVIEVQVDLGASSGIASLGCDAISSGGELTPLGRFHLYEGRAAWAAPETVALADLTGLELVGPAGSVLATASFG